MNNIVTKLEEKEIIVKAYEILLRDRKAMQEEIEIMKPKALFFDQVTGSSQTIDMGEVAKTINLGIGRNNLFALLRDKKVLNISNQPYQNYVDRGYFRIIESSYQKPDGSTHISLKTVVYQKGLKFIIKIVKTAKGLK